MELFLLKLVALFRPVASIKYAEALFDVLGIGLFAILFAAVLMKAALNKSLKLSLIDGVIFAFTVWCVAISVTYYEGTKIGEVAKLLVPVLSYTLVKNVVPDQREYTRLLFWMIVGFSVPTIVSAVLVVTGSQAGIAGVMYWTGVTRWEGAYTNPHNFGHSMTLLMMTLVLYVALRGIPGRETVGVPRMIENTLIGLLGIVALYCLYKSEVRTAILGLLIFAAIYLYCYNKKLLVVGAIGLTVLAVATLPLWFATLLPELDMRRRGIEVESMSLGSGRPGLWMHDILVIAERPIDQQLAGAGIGNRAGFGVAEDQVYGHNDWLEIVTQTGLIGFGLFAMLQVLLLKAILRIPGKERYGFLALFFSVNVMMFVSNSYVWRIQVGHLYYMMLAYVELRQSLRPQVEQITMTNDQDNSATLDKFERGTG